MPRGPISCAIVTALSGDRSASTRLPPAVGHAHPLGGDLQLALQVCYEIHYRGFAGVDPEWEWDPDLIRLRGEMERLFLARVRDEVAGGADAETALDAAATEPPGGAGVSRYLLEEGTWDQMREYFVHRSIYQLKEADPQAWAIPRLEGRAKCAFVAVEYDEFGAGRPERMHATLFEDLLRAAELDHRYLGYLDEVPPETLAIVNLMSLYGLHRALRGALVGHFAAVEITTPPSAGRLVAALERMQAPEECIRFYTEHVEADAVHEQVLRDDVVGALLESEPELAADVVFGVQATELLEDRLAAYLMQKWQRGASTLLPVSGPHRSDNHLMR
ncbi:Iron-containing redox enzyme [Rhodococcus tukisamuensis]|uniref:Iron-containing redox enzyme n=2 Tax=Rhodococcus tukisamuensis TaxID=168276 RepID=A0A1G6VZP1_9NOCA|nr:Iron-containing redox enzyme [Rhodococcus tukisamuensis]